MTTGNWIALAAIVLSLIVSLFGAAGWVIGRVDGRINRLESRIDARIDGLESSIKGLDERIDDLVVIVSHMRGQLDLLSNRSASSELSSVLTNPAARAACEMCHPGGGDPQ
ncbi:MAG: hypothetical protein OXF93_10065 [Acidobacteria bacterium]|nr:hypothetical protein [Acidobacteriota bacterium]